MLINQIRAVLSRKLQWLNRPDRPLSNSKACGTKNVPEFCMINDFKDLVCFLSANNLKVLKKVEIKIANQKILPIRIYAILCQR